MAQFLMAARREDGPPPRLPPRLTGAVGGETLLPPKKRLLRSPLAVLLPALGDLTTLRDHAETFRERLGQTETAREETMLHQVLQWMTVGVSEEDSD